MTKETVEEINFKIGFSRRVNTKLFEKFNFDKIVSELEDAYLGGRKEIYIEVCKNEIESEGYKYLIKRLNKVRLTHSYDLVGNIGCPKTYLVIFVPKI